jgi:hypothetical protein
MADLWAQENVMMMNTMGFWLISFAMKNGLRQCHWNVRMVYNASIKFIDDGCIPMEMNTKPEGIELRTNVVLYVAEGAQ